MSKKRPCCVGGKRHLLFDKRRYSYQVSAVGHGGGPDRVITHYVILRLGKDGNVQDTEDLCVGGHWTTRGPDAIPWQFRSARAADDMARRLSAGLPVHRDRWLGWGAFLLVAAEVTQSVKWWPS